MVTPEEHAAHDAAAEQKVISDVEKYGFHIAQIEGDGYSPSFAYTIGLYKTYGYPELICFGLSLDLLHSVLWSGKELLDKQSAPDQSVGYPDFIGDYDIRLLTVDRAWYKYYFGYGIWVNQGSDFPALQICGPISRRFFLGKQVLMQHGKLGNRCLTATWILSFGKSIIPRFLLPAKY